jgi:acetoin utilization protein AcuB
MLVKEWMSRPVVTIAPDVSMRKARKIMNSNSIGALAVVSDGKLVGLLSDRDLARAEASDATSLSAHELAYLLEKVTVEKIMNSHPVTVEFDATLSEAAELFLENKVQALPVMADGDQLVGMLTRSDLGKAFLKMTSFGRRGVQIGLRISSRPGAVLGIIAAVGNVGARLGSLISTDGHGQETREVYLHIYGVDREKLPSLLDHLRMKGTLLFYADLKTKERKIFDR